MLVKLPTTDNREDDAERVQEIAKIGHAVTGRDRIIMWVAVALSAIWIVFALTYMFAFVERSAVAEMQPHEFAAFVGAMVTPLVILWLVVLYILYRADRQRDAMVFGQLAAGLNYLQPDVEERVRALTSALTQHAISLQSASATAAGGVNDMTRSLSTQATEVEGLPSTAIENLSSLTASLQAAVADLGKAEQSFDNFSKFTTNISETAEKVSGDLVAATTAGEEKTAKWRDVIADAREQMTNTGSAAEALVQQMSATVRSAVGEAEQAGTTFRTQTDDLTAAVQEIGNNVAHLSRSLDDGLGRISGANVEFVDRSSEMMQSGTKVVENLAEAGAVAKVALEQYDLLAQQTEAKLLTTADHAKAELATLTDAIDRARREMESLQHAGETTFAAIQQTSGELRQSGIDFSSFGSQIAEQLRQQVADNDGRIAAITSGFDKVQHGISDMVAAAEERIAELGTTADRSSEKLVETERTARERVEALAAAAEAIGANVTAACAQASKEMSVFDAAGQNAVAQVAEFVAAAGEIEQAADKAQAHGTAFAGALTRARDEAQQLEADLSVRAGEVMELAQTSTGHFRQEAGDMLGSVKEIVEMISAAESELKQRQSKISEIAKEAVQASRDAETVVKGYTQELNSATRAAVEGATSASDLLRQRADDMMQASEQINARVATITPMAPTMDSDEVYRAAAFTLEKLDSISVDLSRYLDKEIPNELWQRYHNGETGLFTKRLVDRRDADAIRRHHRDDAEFRQYVDMYREEFARMIKDVAKTAKPSLFSRALVTSEVGKLYVLLNEALGHN